MKNVFIYATCQGDAIGRILWDNNSFKEHFSRPNLARNYIHIKTNKPLICNSHIMQYVSDCDVFIYQPIGDFYGKHSTNNIFPFLKPSCIRVSIPYITNTSIWPIFNVLKGDMGDNWVDGDMTITHNTYPIDKLLDEGKSYEEILEMADNNDIDWMFKERHDIEMEILSEREKETTVKVSNYIEQNFSNKRMFLYPSHLSADLVLYMSNQIFSILGIEKKECNYDEGGFFPFMASGLIPTYSVEYFKMVFVDKEEMALADKYYKNIITQYLNGRKA